jgi:hypothetical protein
VQTQEQITLVVEAVEEHPLLFKVQTVDLV